MADSARPPRPAAKARLAAILLAAWGCTHVGPLDHALHADSPGGDFSIRYGSGDDEAARQVRDATEHAGEKLTLWGRLQSPVEVEVLPSHKALELAIHRPGYSWLRAWARYREVYVQSPRTWGLTEAPQAQVDELLTHELTHCLMYQLAGTEESWSHKGIPLWFREGMASYTANQGYRRGTLEDLARFYASRGEDPITHAEELYQHQSEIVYSAAHLAFSYLVERYGKEKVRGVLAHMKEGDGFDDAFLAEYGQDRHAFERGFEEYVRGRAFVDGHPPAADGGAVDPGGSSEPDLAPAPPTEPLVGTVPGAAAP